MANRVPFTHAQLDRADHLRSLPEEIARLRADPAARLVNLEGLWPVVEDDCLQRIALDRLPDQGELVFLGFDEESPLFASVPGEGDARPAAAQSNIWHMLALLSAKDLAIYGCARSIVDWHARHRFCARCGSATQAAKAGWQRSCPECSTQHFPRVDPVVIMLVEHDGDLLLGRQESFPPGLYSALAGFVEPGESIEEAVAREVAEEAGIAVRQVGYIASQPWPFPSQLMIGCHASARGREIRIDPNELEDARWFSRTEVAEAVAGKAQSTAFTVPPARAIAHYMLSWWLDTHS